MFFAEIKQKLKIYAHEITELSSLYFGFISLTFENNSQNWIIIENVKIDFNNKTAGENIKITSGKELLVWKETVFRNINLFKDPNIDLFLLMNYDNDFLNSCSTNNESCLNTKPGYSQSMTINEYNANAYHIQNSGIFPDDHLLARDFAVPPGLFVKKWLLLNTIKHHETGLIYSFNLEYKAQDEQSEIIKLVFRERNAVWNNSGWQKELFDSGNIHMQENSLPN